MMTELIDRRKAKAETRELLRSAQVNPKAFTALYLALAAAMSILNMAVSNFTGETTSLLGLFVTILVNLIGAVLGAGFTLYCMEIRRGQRAEFLSLFDGFSFAGKVIVLQILTVCFVFLWCLLLFFPGIIAAYRYRFALYHLCENPEISPMEALRLSKQTTMGYKGQLFMLDVSFLGWSLLASLPSMLYSAYLSAQLLDNPYLMMSAITIPPLVFVTAQLWSALVGIFYLPLARCTDLAYFETAKRTRNVGAHTSPDGLGGL